MKFTGERYIPTEQGKIRLEHYHRYAMVLDLIKDKAVLDVACGEGYGSFLMADVACSVVGVDISGEVVQHASSLYKRQNLTFRQDSATNLNFSDASFDTVVSFETIEHLTEQAQMLAEIRRVLRPGGLLVISSPNRPVYSEASGEHNEFHVKELDFSEFDDLLRTKFPAIVYFGQRLLMGSVIQPLEGGQSVFRAWRDDGNTLKPNAGKLSEPVYFLAVCGADSATLPTLDMSVLYPDNLDLIKHYVGFAKWAQSLDKTVLERDDQISSLNQAVTERDDQISSLNQAVTERDDQISSLNQVAAKRNAEIIRITHILSDCQARLRPALDVIETFHRSLSWRITAPLRALHGLFVNKTLGHSARYLSGNLENYLFKIFHMFPMGGYHQEHIRAFLFSSFPWFFKDFLAYSLWQQRQISAKAAITPKVPIVSDANEISIEDVTLTTSNNPIISIIIPVYGQIAYTLHCLKSIVNNTPDIPFEVIVIDDKSPDNSLAILSKIKGITLISNDKNLGFIRSCNTGAQSAKGEYIYFLNNDTEVTAGWLTALYRTFSDFPDTGLVGSKLIYPDGRLQEAGGIIWQDGSAWNFGRFQDPQLPVYNYAREVDYCSGASIMVPKALFDALGGFDEHYLPAYCEDSDLAIKIRDKGYRVIYQPMSAVIHFEGITSGTDTTQGTKAYQVENSKKLFERWQYKLVTHQANGVDVDNAKDRVATRRVLVLDLCTPTPNQDSGSIDAYNHMLLLREMNFQVTFIPEDNFLYMPEYTPALQRVGVEMLYAPFVTSVEQHVREFGHRYDLIFISRPATFEREIEIIRKYCKNAKVLFHTVDLHFLRMIREAELLNSYNAKKDALEMKKRELRLIAQADVTTVLSYEELAMLNNMLPNARVKLLPYARTIVGTYNKFEQRRDIVFVGGYQHTPNVDAVKHFVEEVMPLVRKQLPGIHFYVVGSKPPAEIQALASEDVIIMGFVEDLSPLLDKMRVSVAPLRFGAGIKGKIGTAMAAGLPVVATPLAAEGMSLTDGENILVADGTEAFAEAITSIYQDEALWNRISKNGLAFANIAWGAEAAWKTLSGIVLELGVPSERSQRKLSLYITRH